MTGDSETASARCGAGDVNFCPQCGSEVSSEGTTFKNDLVLNRYRTEFGCLDCGYHGEVFRHEQ